MSRTLQDGLWVGRSATPYTRGLLSGSWDASAIPFLSCIRLQPGTARDAWRYRAEGLVRAGLSGWVVSATPNGTIVSVLLALMLTKHAAQLGSTTCGSKRSRCGVKGSCGVCDLQGRPGSGSPEAQYINDCARDTSRQCEEAGGGRQGSPRRERATGSSLASRLPCVRRPT